MFPSNGVVTHWRHLSSYSRPFKAIVFRETERHLTFEIVGMNDVPGGTPNHQNEYEVPIENRIKVKEGDYMGWAYAGGGAFWSGDTEDLEDIVRYSNAFPIADLRKGQAVYTGQYIRRRYSVQGVLNSSKCVFDMGVNPGGHRDTSPYISRGGGTQNQRSSLLIGPKNWSN